MYEGLIIKTEGRGLIAITDSKKSTIDFNNYFGD